MELMAGYKQTEVGVIPTDWEVQSVNHISVIRTGPFGTLLKASEYSAGDGVPLISVGEIRHGFLKISTHTPRISTAIARRLPQFVLQAGDIVFGRKGGVDRSALIQKSQNGWFIGSDGIIVRPVKNIYCAFLAFQLQSERVKDWLLQNAIGTTMPSLNQGILGKVVVPLPPTKVEQEVIAEALSDADALIESLDQLIAKKRQIKQGAMQELLTGKRRLPGFEGEWVIKRLGDVAEISKGQLITESTAIPGDVPVIAGGKKPAYFHNRANRTGKTITISGSGASAGYVAFYESPIFASDCSTIGEGGNYSVEFIYFVLLLNQEVIYKAQTGGAQPHIHPDDLRPLMIHVPIDCSEQAAIATILSDMDAELAALESRLAKARQIKQGMMQELLTGRIRLL